MEKRSEMSARQSIAIVAGPFEGNRKSWLARVPRKVSTVTFRTVKALWYGEIENPDHWAARDIRRAAEIIEMRKTTSNFADQLKNLIGEDRADNNKNFSSAEIDLIRRFARSISGEDST
jgi:homogentisate 1,2-dioxygenase